MRIRVDCGASKRPTTLSAVSRNLSRPPGPGPLAGIQFVGRPAPIQADLLAGGFGCWRRALSRGTFGKLSSFNRLACSPEFDIRAPLQMQSPGKRAAEQAVLVNSRPLQTTSSTRMSVALSRRGALGVQRRQPSCQPPFRDDAQSRIRLLRR